MGFANTRGEDIESANAAKTPDRAEATERELIMRVGLWVRMSVIECHLRKKDDVHPTLNSVVLDDGMRLMNHSNGAEA